MPFPRHIPGYGLAYYTSAPFPHKGWVIYGRMEAQWVEYEATEGDEEDARRLTRKIHGRLSRAAVHQR